MTEYVVRFRVGPVNIWSPSKDEICCQKQLPNVVSVKGGKEGEKDRGEGGLYLGKVEKFLHPFFSSEK